MRKNNKLLTPFVPVLFLLALAFPCQAYEYILVSNPLFHKIPLGMSQIKPVASGNSVLHKTGLEAEVQLNEMLLFTGYFKSVDRPNPSPVNGLLSSDPVDYPAWQKANAELLISGIISSVGSKVRLDLYLYDVFKKKRLIGKRYEASPKDIREVIRRFATAVMEKLTSSPGFFNSKIAFVNREKGKKDIIICDFDGKFTRKFTTDEHIKVSPAWSPDGKWVAFTTYEKGSPDLCIRKYKGNKSYWVQKPGINITPAWLPSSDKLAATLSINNDQDIYLLTAQGKITKRLTNRWGIDVSPSFSPDGQLMVFVSNRGGSPQLYIKDLRSEHVRRLTYEGKYNTSPSWSSDGKRIAFSGMVKGRNHIFTIHADGTGLMQLTDSPGDNESPSWSPDGSHIVFSSTREGGRSKIYVMSAFGTDQRRLLSFNGEQTDPCWSPNVFN